MGRFMSSQLRNIVDLDTVGPQRVNIDEQDIWPRLIGAGAALLGALTPEHHEQQQ